MKPWVTSTPRTVKLSERGKRFWLRGLLRDESGVTAVEFGLLALPFFAIIGAILETAVVFLASSVLDSAVDQGTRIVRTGQAQSKKLTAADFQTEICGHLYQMFDCDKLKISVKTKTTFSSAKPTFPIDVTDGTWKIVSTYQPGKGNDIILVEVYYKWPTIIDLYNFNLSNSGDGNRLMSAVRVFRNEPF